ncbi:hypothetical protein AX15_005702 [Amanita polypyramis BW_CC]|nr:hypothetical protein AX15_005702 [Amanita polypyramis BW_CC]
MRRSTEAPMDFQWTNRPNTKPVWATVTNDPNTPRKRSHDDLTSSTPTLGTAVEPTFGSNQNIPFIFSPGQLPQKAPNPQLWIPPAQFSPAKAFPPPTIEEIRDVDMSDASPGKTEETGKEGRTIALGALRRIHNLRRKAKLAKKQRRDGDSSDDEELDSDDDSSSISMARSASNHYTLNLPGPSILQPDMPYVLLGYLQFFFNLSLILLFLYLVMQFILTVQRDVEQRISGYSMEIIQEISLCALQHRDNLCSTNPVPAMVRQCSNWETCMNRDPTVVGRAKVGAELIAEVVNGFVEPISWKTLVFVLTSLSFLTIFINTLLSLYRSRHHPNSASSQVAYPAPPYPPHPPHHYGSFLPPGPEAGWSSLWKTGDENMQNATRRRRLEGGVSVKVK